MSKKDWQKMLEGIYEPRRWDVIEVTEAGKTWWEVRSGILAICHSESHSPVRFRSLRAAQRARDKNMRRDMVEANRTERIVK